MNEKSESNSSLLFGDPILYDSKGLEVEIPECPKCGIGMNMILGKKAMIWYCCEHGLK